MSLGSMLIILLSAHYEYCLKIDTKASALRKKMFFELEATEGIKALSRSDFFYFKPFCQEQCHDLFTKISLNNNFGIFGSPANSTFLF